MCSRVSIAGGSSVAGSGWKQKAVQQGQSTRVEAVKQGQDGRGYNEEAVQQGQDRRRKEFKAESSAAGSGRNGLQ
jgi:hypothetical protein